MTPHLLERQVELQMLGTAVERAGTGRGSAVLILGEAGVGKTSLVQAFCATLDVLRYIAPRIRNLPAVLLVTYMDSAKRCRSWCSRSDAGSTAWPGIRCRVSSSRVVGKASATPLRS